MFFYLALASADVMSRTTKTFACIHFFANAIVKLNTFCLPDVQKLRQTFQLGRGLFRKEIRFYVLVRNQKSLSWSIAFSPRR